MAKPVQGDLVSGSGDLAHQRRPALHLLADHKERRSRARARENLERGRRPLGVRAVVKGQGDAAGAGKPAREPERAGSTLVDRGQEMTQHAQMMADPPAF